MLGTKSSAITGTTRVAWRTGHTSVGKCRPQSHSGRSAMLRKRVARCFHAEPPTEFTSTSERTWRRHVVGERTATPPPNEWPTTTAGSSISKHVEQVGDPLGVAADRERRARQIAAATEAGHRRGDHLQPCAATPRSPCGTCAGPAPSRAAAPPACLRRPCCTPPAGPAPRCAWLTTITSCHDGSYCLTRPLAVDHGRAPSSRLDLQRDAVDRHDLQSGTGGDRRRPVGASPPPGATDHGDALGIDRCRSRVPSWPIIHSRPMVGVANRVRTIDGMPTMNVSITPTDADDQRDPSEAQIVAGHRLVQEPRADDEQHDARPPSRTVGMPTCTSIANASIDSSSSTTADRSRRERAEPVAAEHQAHRADRRRRCRRRR